MTMPIRDLQVRLRELGRIRIGALNGKRPDKLDTFRVTSPHRDLVQKCADLYGGTVREWTPLGGGAAQWEVITTTTSIPVVVPPANAYSQWYELWSGGGCQRRCDGDRETLTDSPCRCASQDERTCKPTTRLNVMLRDIPALGVWRLESKGWNSAVELPGVADLCSRLGTEVSARLVLEQRTSKDGGKTRHFMVPGLIPDITPDQLVGIGNASRQAIAASAPVAIESAPQDFVGLVPGASTLDEVRGIWLAARDAGALTDELKAALQARGAEIEQAAGAVPDENPAPPDEPTFDDNAWLGGEQS